MVELVEEQGNISMQNISPVVKAELLQDHSMAITFGGDSEMSFKNLVDTVRTADEPARDEKYQNSQRIRGKHSAYR